MLPGTVSDHPLLRDMLHVWLRMPRARLHVALFAADADDGSAARRAAARAVDALVDVSGRDAVGVAAAVCAARLHVLIDLSGYTFGADTALLARRLAPLQVRLHDARPLYSGNRLMHSRVWRGRQVLFKGYAGTLGGGLVSHVLSDRVATPPQLAGAQLAERAALLPHALFANSHRDAHAAVLLGAATHADRAAAGLPLNSSAPVLCCFNHLGKARFMHTAGRGATRFLTACILLHVCIFCTWIVLQIDRTVFEVWMRLLRDVPDRCATMPLCWWALN
jgi:protein O-GlcNAc transferase